MSNWVNVNDARTAAKSRAHRMVFDYIDGGAGDEATLRRNQGAFDQFDLNHRVLAGIDAVDSSIELLGNQLDVPFFTSPTAANRLFHTEGELAVASAAHAIGSLYSLSTLSSVSIEDIAAASPGPKWFQLYVWKDRGLVKEMLDRARDAGFRAVVLTVDLPVHGSRDRDVRNQFGIPLKLGLRHVWDAINAPRWTLDYLLKPTMQFANLPHGTSAMSLAKFVDSQLDSTFSWRDAEWLLGEWNGPSVIKGVVRQDDAHRAVDVGFDAIMVSNHGGRQLDRSPAPISVLGAIVSAVGDRADVILDGGVRRGIDVVTALALGAKAVSFGRPYLFGLAADGQRGVTRVLEIMAAEVRNAMALVGAATVDQLDRSMVTRRSDREIGRHPL